MTSRSVLRRCVSHVTPRIQVVHAVAGRVRLRVAGMHFDGEAMAAVERRLQSARWMLSYRIVKECRSITVCHATGLAVVLRAVEDALCGRTSEAQHLVSAATVRGPRPMPLARSDERAAGRRIGWCSAIGLALTIVPTPAKPVWIAARIALGLVVGYVRWRAEQEAETPPIAKLLDRAGSLVDLVRADNRLRHVAGSVLRPLVHTWLQPQVLCGRARPMLMLQPAQASPARRLPPANEPLPLAA